MAHTTTSQIARILRLLKAAGSEGVTNGQLNKIAFRYGAAIYDLRKEGHNIQSIHVKDGLWRFVYNKED